MRWLLGWPKPSLNPTSERWVAPAEILAGPQPNAEFALAVSRPLCFGCDAAVRAVRELGDFRLTFEVIDSELAYDIARAHGTVLGAGRLGAQAKGAVSLCTCGRSCEPASPEVLRRLS